MRWNTGRQLIVHVNQNPECPIGDLGFPEHRQAAWNTRPQPNAEPVDDLIKRCGEQHGMCLVGDDCGNLHTMWEAETALIELRDRIAALEAENARLMGLVETAAAAERARIVAWLRGQCSDPMLPEYAEFLGNYADAIERGEV
jgi:hypothetical protein